MAVASLAVALTARVGRFVDGMKRAQKAVSRFLGPIAAIGKRVGQFATVGIVAAVAGLTALTKHAFSTMDAVSKLSDRINMSTEDIIRLQHAARITGSDIGSLQKGLEMLVRRVGEATTGTGEAADMFALLGVNARELAGKTGIEQFEAVRSAIAALPNAAQRAEAAMAIFGRQGLKLLNLLQLEEEQFELLKQQADDLGLTFDRVAGVQIERANDAFTMVKETFLALGQAIAVRVAPLVVLLSQKIVDFVKQAGGVGPIVSRGFEIATLAIGRFADYLELARAGWYSMKIAANAVLQGITELLVVPIAQVNALARALGIDAVQGVEDFAFAMRRALAEQGIEDFNGLETAMKNFRDRVHTSGIARSFGEINAQAREASEAIANMARSTGEVIDFEALLEGLRKKPQQARTPKPAATRSLETFFGAGVLSPFVRAISGVRFGQEGQRVKVDEMPELLLETKRQTQIFEANAFVAVAG